MIDKSTEICRNLLDSRFFRIDPVLEEELPLDKPELLPEMVRCAQEHDLTDCFQWIETMLLNP